MRRNQATEPEWGGPDGPWRSRRDRRWQHRHDTQCPPEEGCCVCCCGRCDWTPRGGRPRSFILVTAPGGSLHSGRQLRIAPRGRITAGPTPLGFPHRRRHW